MPNLDKALLTATIELKQKAEQLIPAFSTTPEGEFEAIQKIRDERRWRCPHFMQGYTTQPDGTQIIACQDCGIPLGEPCRTFLKT